jgi:hypothetical protein
MIAPMSPEDYLQTQWDFFWHYWYVWALLLAVAAVFWLLSKLD